MARKRATPTAAAPCVTTEGVQRRKVEGASAGGAVVEQQRTGPASAVIALVSLTLLLALVLPFTVEERFQGVLRELHFGFVSTNKAECVEL